MYLCGPGKHNCQPFCGPEGRFYCSDSVCSLWPAPFSYLCVSVMILCVLKTVCGWTSKNWLLPYACCGLHFIDSAACVSSFDHTAPLQLWRCESRMSGATRDHSRLSDHGPDRSRQPWWWWPATNTTDAGYHNWRPRLATSTTDGPG